MLYFSVQDGVLFKSYLPGNMKKRSAFRNQLVLPKFFVGFVLHSYYDHAEVTWRSSQRINKFDKITGGCQ